MGKKDMTSYISLLRSNQSKYTVKLINNLSLNFNQPSISNKLNQQKIPVKKNYLILRIYIICQLKSN